MTLHRLYCFFDENAKEYQLHIYRQLPRKRFKEQKKLELPIKNPANLIEIGQFLEKALSDELTKLQNDFFFQKFWELADDKQQVQLLLSIYLRKENPKGVFNIEIENWLDDGPFGEIYRESKKIFKSWRPREILTRMIITSGYHKKSIRLGNIHLALDRVNGEDVYSIHYDKYNPNQLRSLGLIKHFLFEDRRQEKLL